MKSVLANLAELATTGLPEGVQCFSARWIPAVPVHLQYIIGPHCAHGGGERDQKGLSLSKLQDQCCCCCCCCIVETRAVITMYHSATKPRQRLHVPLLSSLTCCTRRAATIITRQRRRLIKYSRVGVQPTGRPSCCCCCRQHTTGAPWESPPTAAVLETLPTCTPRALLCPCRQ